MATPRTAGRATWPSSSGSTGGPRPSGGRPAAGVTASQLGDGNASNGWKGHVAELVVFDRALTAFERKSVEDYLALRYPAHVPPVGAPAFAPTGGGRGA